VRSQNRGKWRQDQHVKMYGCPSRQPRPLISTHNTSHIFHQRYLNRGFAIMVRPGSLQPLICPNCITDGPFQLPVATPGAFTIHLHLDVHALRLPGHHGQEQGRVRNTSQSESCLAADPINSVMAVFWRAARIGERLSPYVSICCVAMAVSILHHSSKHITHFHRSLSSCLRWCKQGRWSN